MHETTGARISDSYFEYKADFLNPVFDAWAEPNPLARSLFQSLRKWGITLADVSWSKEPRNLKEIQLTISVLQMNAAVQLGVDSAIFLASNADWSRAPALVELFDTAMASIRQVSGAQLASQETVLAFHLVPGQEDLGRLTQNLVNADILGPARMYGISLYREDSSLVIDGSLRYVGGIFMRINRRFSESTSFSEIAATLYKDELRSLDLLGLGKLISE